MELSDRTAVVTGGASGIGAATADLLAKAGAHVVTWDLAGGPDVVCDVTDPAAVDAAMASTVERHRTPTIMVACAGIGRSGPLADVTVEAFDQVMDVNLKGAWLCLRAAHAAMRQGGNGGAIVTITSVSARLVDRGMGPYCASKAALEMLTRVAAHEWAVDGIRVNAVGPGVTQTPMLGRAPETGMTDEVVGRTPLGRLGEAVDVAQAVLALLTLDWVTGQVLMADGGLSLQSPIDMYGAAMRMAAGREERHAAP